MQLGWQTLRIALRALMSSNLEPAVQSECGEGGAKGAERPKGETKRPEGAERKTLAHKLEDSKVIDYRGLLHDLYVVYI